VDWIRIIEMGAIGAGVGIGTTLAMHPRTRSLFSPIGRQGKRIHAALKSKSDWVAQSAIVELAPGCKQSTLALVLEDLRVRGLVEQSDDPTWPEPRWRASGADAGGDGAR